MSTYKELLAQQAELDRRIAEARRAEVASATAQVREIVASFGLTAEDIFSAPGKSPKGTSGTKVAPKYRNPATGETWTGRGKAPRWLDGKDRDQYLIAA